MASRHDWLEEGFKVLSEEGAPALTVERLCGRLGLTKGSFYHHFKGMAGFKTDLLQHFEEKRTVRYLDAADHTAGPPQARLDHLLELVLAELGDGLGLEVAIRAWAAQDAEVRAAQERVDRLRIDYLSSLWREAGGAEADDTPMARLLYLVLVGAGHVVPPVSVEDLRDIYRLALRLVPGDNPRRSE
ncbi:TetR/AcrR family transcriptional regulator [Streptosporangium sp. NPDC000396]|uniref:TetR/AcrR family transcriptional regulator n=1 Tax=Streptosporangium sp. NPDC000396 TaxID=3366185 RepID=UPI0036A2A7DE